MALANRLTRQRGRRWLLLGVLATLVVLAVHAAVSARSPAPARQLAQQSYMDQLLPAIMGSTQQGQDLNAVRTQALTMSGTAITSRIDQVVDAAKATLGTVERLKPPKELQTAHDLLVATMAIRVQAAQSLNQAMTGALSGNSTPAAVSALTGAATELTAGDLTYQMFLKTPASGSPGSGSSGMSGGTALPASVWVPDPTAYSSAELTVFVTTLKASTTLAPVHDTSIVLVTTDPSPVSVEGTTQVLPVSKSLNLQIVVANAGNQPEKNLTVSATITPSFFGPSQMVRNFITLAPGQRQTVDLGGLRAQVGQATTLTIKIDTVAGEANVADNTKAITLLMR
jgi:hypothetical protein